MAASEEITIDTQVSVIIPAKNEAQGLAAILPELKSLLPEAEIIVVDDGSTDNTASLCRGFDVRVVSHPYSMGNGAAVKTGSRHARGEILVFMDGDGQHRPAYIPKLLERLGEGFDMVVGARSYASQAGMHRAAANGVYNRIASWMVGQTVADLTSGFRAVKADLFRKFMHLLPNGFSYPTTITMSFFRAGFPVTYIPIEAPRRIGKSHMRLVRDGIRFLVIIFKIGSLYSPLKLFLPISFGFFALGFVHYLYNYITAGRFTNMTALLFITSILVFLIGLVSEQITSLNYKDSHH